MRPIQRAVGASTVILLLAGCAGRPIGPAIAAMPAPGKPLDVFQDDEVVCERYADQSVAGGAQAANNEAVGGAVLGTVLGAGLGAAIGGGRGAAIGAASGALLGTGVGASQSSNAQYGIQHRYDIAYAQCMYSRGNTIPEFGWYQRSRTATAVPPSPQARPPASAWRSPDDNPPPSSYDAAPQPLYPGQSEPQPY